MARIAPDAKECEARPTIQDDTSINPTIFIEMKVNVGSILFLWSSVEREGPEPGGIYRCEPLLTQDILKAAARDLLS
ncbi:hypothetical protein [Octadecabacter antarcticus]|uniref:hypothetical protein n=1 Tax=Octadecabacter antarcticus TaxID=1217908 RepID=UPI0001806CE8|nr:hypothetical protein [Octadecabacter antarcticus]